MFTFKKWSWSIFLNGFLSYFISKFLISLANIPSTNLNFYHFVLWFLVIWGIKSILTEFFLFVRSHPLSKTGNLDTKKQASN